MENFNYDDIIFDYYPANIKIAEPLGTVSLSSFLNSVRSPRKEIQEIFLKIQEATKRGDMVEKDNLKKSLYSFTPSILTDGMGRSYDNVVKINPVMVVEFDKVEFAQELKEYIFNKMTCVVAAMLSPSKKGCKFLIRIPAGIKTIEEYKEYFCGIAFYLDQIQNFDIANFNLILPFFLTWDEGILIRPAKDTTVWETRGSKVNAFRVVSAEDFELPGDINERDKEEVVDKISFLINRIEDNAHTQILSTSLVAGGYCASNYMDVSEMEELLHSLIKSNAYMSKGTSGYCRTASQFLIRGMAAPLLLKRHEDRVV